MINAPLAVIEELQKLRPGDPSPALENAKLEELRKHNLFENIVSISNAGVEDVSSCSDFFSRQHRVPHGDRLFAREEEDFGAADQRERGHKRVSAAVSR
jgi:hypothetical protein